jgi:hypothetical protein
MLLYDLSTHPDATALLTAKVTGLAAAQQRGHQATAERLLKLRSPAYTAAEDVENIALALVHQMNFQVAQGIDPQFVSSAASTHARQSDVYRDRYVSPVAADIVAEVAAQYPSEGRYAESFTSHRTRGGTG